jgi:hypothetical protein
MFLKVQLHCYCTGLSTTFYKVLISCSYLTCNYLTSGISCKSMFPKLFIVLKHSTSSCVPPLAPGSAHSSCVPPLAPGSAHSQMLFFCHHCKPATHTLYDTFIKHKNECEFLPQSGSWEVTKSSYRTRPQIIIINHFSLSLAI